MPSNNKSPARLRRIRGGEVKRRFTSSANVQRAMTREAKSWEEMTRYMRELLVRQTGEDVDAWKAKIAAHGKPTDADKLRAWLAKQGVTGYPRMLLVYETFGYPDFFNRSADELIDAQYEDRPALRPVLDSLLLAAEDVGEVTVQARKGYISLVARRQFAIIRATTRTRVDLGLRLEKAKPGRRWVVAKGLGNDTIRWKVGLARAEDVDDEVVELLRRAYEENR
jgi:Domain of unknown function (DUF5655)